MRRHGFKGASLGPKFQAQTESDSVETHLAFLLWALSQASASLQLLDFFNISLLFFSGVPPPSDESPKYGPCISWQFFFLFYPDFLWLVQL